MENVKAFELPFLDNKMKFEEESARVMNLDHLLTNLTNNSQNAFTVADKAESLEEKIQKIPLKVGIFYI